MKFGEWALTKIKTKRGALMGAWGLGLFIFLDDYMSALTVGFSMKKITDAFKIPREKLAYIVNTTAAPWCVVVPLSTWTIFVGNILSRASSFGINTRMDTASGCISVRAKQYHLSRPDAEKRRNQRLSSCPDWNSRNKLTGYACSFSPNQFLSWCLRRKQIENCRIRAACS